MQTATITADKTATAADLISNVEAHIADLQAELDARVLRGENHIIRHRNGLPIVRVTTQESLVGFRIAQSVLRASRWTERGAENVAAGINNSFPQYSVEAVPYLEAVRDEIANARKVIQMYQSI
jgi:hypothetical protein